MKNELINIPSITPEYNKNLPKNDLIQWASWIFLNIKKKNVLDKLKKFSALFSILLLKKLLLVSKEKNSTLESNIHIVIKINIKFNIKNVRGNLFKLYLNKNLKSKTIKFDLQIALLNELFIDDKNNIDLYKLNILYKDTIKKIEFKE